MVHLVNLKTYFFCDIGQETSLYYPIIVITWSMSLPQNVFYFRSANETCGSGKYPYWFLLPVLFFLQSIN